MINLLFYPYSYILIHNCLSYKLTYILIQIKLFIKRQKILYKNVLLQSCLFILIC